MAYIKSLCLMRKNYFGLIILLKEPAFNNQCVNPADFKAIKYMALHDKMGSTNCIRILPLYCENVVLCHPSLLEDKKTGEKRLMKGFVSAYKRMNWDEPASTLTQNFQYACSDNKLHPDQSRVLSLYEGLIIQSIASIHFLLPQTESLYLTVSSAI